MNSKPLPASSFCPLAEHRRRAYTEPKQPGLELSRSEAVVFSVTEAGPGQRRETHYSGQVQGVGFRFQTLRIARAYEVAGFVRNLPDGRVELVAEGRSGPARPFPGRGGGIHERVHPPQHHEDGVSHRRIRRVQHPAVAGWETSSPSEDWKFAAWDEP